PAMDSTEPVNFTYTVVDEDNLPDTGNVAITFTQLPPVADDEVVMGAMINTPIEVDALLGDNDPDGDNADLTITEITDPVTGITTPIDAANPVTLSDGTVVSLVGGELVVTPATDSTEDIDFTYTVADEDGLTDTGNVEITFTQLPPTTVVDAAETDPGTSVNINALDNDDDEDGDNANLMITSITDPLTGTVTPIAPGSAVTLDDGSTVTLNTNGTLDVVPGPGVTLVDFDYTVTDEDGLTATGDVEVTVNEPPIADDEVVTGQTNDGNDITVDVLDGDRDPDNTNGVLTITEITDPVTGITTPIDVANPVTLSDGTVVSLVGGELVVTPASTDPIDFTYTVEDEDGLTDTGSVDITFTQLPPTADNETVTDGAINTPVNISVLEGDNDPDGDNANLMITEIIDADGTVTPIAPGATVTLSDGTMVTLQTNGTLDVVPAPDSTEDIDFSYTVTDEDGLTATGAVDITFDQLPPVAEDDQVDGATINTPVTVDALNGDDDADGDNANLTITEITDPVTGITSPIDANNPVTLDDGTV
uniref:Ig-like domain-containing protein n=1 Tax=uncultured Polaribacter sp. TaxID=174711 RepID=UPI0026376695